MLKSRIFGMMILILAIILAVAFPACKNGTTGGISTGIIGGGVGDDDDMLPAGKYSVIIQHPPKHYGTVTASLSSAAEGETVEITVVSKEGYKFKQWEVSDGVTLSGATTTETFNMPAKNVTIKALFDIDTNNAYLSGLDLSPLTLSPPFDPEITDYTISVPNSVDTVTVSATAESLAATFKINGNDGPSVSVSLGEGGNTIEVIVTAEDGTNKTYTITITRATPAASSNADLSSLSLSSGTLSPAFASVTTSYTASVANSVTSVTVSATAADGGATVEINSTLASSLSVPLSVGDNPISIKVTAADSTTKTYTVTVARATPAASSNADLSSLSLSSGTLSPVFASGTTSYEASVANSVTSVTVSATAADGGAIVEINSTLASSLSVPLSVGDNPISIKVTAADSTTKTYTVTVNREADSSQEYNYGDTGPGGGIVFYYDPDGFYDTYTDSWCNYLEAALPEQCEKMPWYVNEGVGAWTNKSIDQNSDIGTGRKNTDLILYTFGANAAAANFCWSNTFGDGSENDWFLPSIDELLELYNNCKDIYYDVDELLHAWWSSTQVGLYYINNLDLDGSIQSVSTNMSFYVCPVRAF